MDICLENSLNLLTKGWQDYELIDSGEGQKLERFGPYYFIRPEPQALWPRQKDAAVWAQAVGEFSSTQEDKGRWTLDKSLPASWPMRFEDVQFEAMPTPFRHLGFFPEQAPHWQWTAEKIKGFIAQHKRPPRLLNLFAYSGVASLHAAQAGADVTHLDASKKAVAQAFRNRDLSGLEAAPIRFITDDALRFIQREIRRERFYDAILLDPPKYGRGPKGEIWQLHADLPELLKNSVALLSDTPVLMIATIYAIRTSTLAVQSALADALSGYGGKIESGELALMENQKNARVIGQALYARWSKDPA